MTTSRDGMRDAMPVFIGYVTLGLAAGMLLSAKGLAWWWAPLWCLIIYSGTMQMFLVPLVAAGEPMAAIAASAVFVSGRHVFYGFGFPLDRIRGRWFSRLYGVHAITDEVYALLASKDRLAMTGRYVLTVEMTSQTGWFTGNIVGALAGAGLASLVGERVELLGFVLTALFVTLAIENWKTHPDLAVLGLGVMSGMIALTMGGSASLLSGLGVLATGLVVLYAWRQRTDRSSATEPPAAEPPGITRTADKSPAAESAAGKSQTIPDEDGSVEEVSR